MSDYVPTVKLGARVFRLPYHAVIRPMNALERRHLKEDILRAGRIEQPIILDQHGDVLDGINRLQIACEAGISPASINFVTRHVKDVEDAIAVVRSCNAARRHLTPAEQEEARRHRRRTAAEMRDDDPEITTREIAKALGTSHMTVARDLAATGESVTRVTDSPVEERRRRVSALRAEGKSAAAIAEEVGAPLSTVKNDLKALPDAPPATVKGKDGKARKNPASAPNAVQARQRARAAAERRKQEMREEARRLRARLREEDRAASGRPAPEFNFAREVSQVRNLLAKRRESWPADWRGIFAGSVTRILDGMRDGNGERERLTAAGWTPGEIERRSLVLLGHAVVANQHKGRDEMLRRWAEVEGLLVRIDRKTEWGNPFEMPRDGGRDEVCDKFAAGLGDRPDLLARVPELRGRVLACWCHPERCHGHRLAALANGE